MTKNEPKDRPPREPLDLAIVTSCHNYGRWLPEWARSIAGQERFLPKRVAIIDNGSTDLTPRKISEALEILEAAGIEAISERIPFTDFGSARNAAVELGGDAEWIQHLDADDKLLPFALADFAELAPEADVVGFGYQRFGDLEAGPRNRTRTYSNHQGEETLRSTAPCSGVSPFRRSFWEQSPYRTDMEGGWDTALWIGFAHLGARFVATRRPVFLYRQHARSIFNSRRVNARRSAFVGTKLANLRRAFEGVSVLIPFRGNNELRSRACEFVRGWYAEHHPEWELVASDSPSPAWRKGEAVDRAMREARGEILVIADADVFLDPSVLEEAVELVRSGAPWVVPHGLVHRLDAEATELALEEGPGAALEELEALEKPGLARPAYRGFAGGGIVVVERSGFQASFGIPDGFRGWGAEDEALAAILDSLLGPHERLEADLWHLWHGREPRTKAPRYKENRALYRMLLRVAPDPDALYDALVAMRAGREPEDAVATAGGDGIAMLALETFKRAQETIEKGAVFYATEAELRLHRGRPRKIARPVTPADRQSILNHSKQRTLDIRAAQRRRNEAARKEKEEAKTSPGY